jgi:phage tail sheath protein FI
MSPFAHGITIQEIPTSIVPPVEADAALPFVVGTSPVHLITGQNGPVNEVKLYTTYAEAVAAIGYSTDWDSYTLSEFLKCYFSLYNRTPVMVVNVFDPATHKTNVVSEEQTLDADDELQLDYVGVIGAPVVKDVTDTTTYVVNDDYTIDNITGILTRVPTGAISPLEVLHITYDYGDPSLVDADDIIGAIGGGGELSGLECINAAYPEFVKVPGLILAPGWSDQVTVAAAMIAKTDGINAVFKAMALVDLPITVTRASEAAAVKATNNLTDENVVPCWPKVKNGTDEYWMSSHLAGLMGKTDHSYGDVPFKAPSNERAEISGAVNNSIDIYNSPPDMETLNGIGVTTVMKSPAGGWKMWGTRTGAYPASADVKDNMISIRRMFNWIGNTLVLTFQENIDDPILLRTIQAIVDSVNIWLNGMVGLGQLLGGRCQFVQGENPVTDIMNGNIKFHVWVTPPSPAEKIEFFLEYDPAYLQALFS